MAQLKTLSEFNGAPKGPVMLAYMLEASPLLRSLDSLSAWEESSLEGRWRPAVDASTVGYRALDTADAPTYTNEALESEQTFSLKVLYDGIERDNLRVLDEMRGHGTAEVDWEKKLKLRAKNYGKGIEKEFFRGTGLTTNMKGLSTILNGTTDLPGFTGVKGVLNAATYGYGTDQKSFDWSVDANFAYRNAKFIEMMDEALAMVDNPNVIYANSKLYSRIMTAAREKLMVGTVVDYFGKTLSTYNDIPIVKVLDTTILNTEEDDTTTPLTNTTSLYIGSLGELKTSIVTNSGLWYMNWDNANNTFKGREYWQMSAGWKVEEPKSILRVRNIKL